MKSGSRNIVQGIMKVELDLPPVVSLVGFGPQQRAQFSWNTRAWTYREALLSPQYGHFLWRRVDMGAA